MKPQRFWAVVDEHNRVLPEWGNDDNCYMRMSVDRGALCPGMAQRIVRVEVRVVAPKPKKRKARKGAK